MTTLSIVRHTQMPYPESVQEQEAYVAEILAGTRAPTLIFTEHPPIYTIGSSGSDDDILTRNIDGDKIETFATGRGGEVTYHGPGQLVCYMLADLRNNQDLHQHVWRLEEMVIRTLADFDMEGVRDSRGIGVWVNQKKIAAIGVRCRKWITYHGIALNIHPNLNHYAGIIPCGMKDAPVTSMLEQDYAVSRENVEQIIIKHAQSLFSFDAE